jgi:heterotetrameric sarcosine oxidase gamma subunit
MADQPFDLEAHPRRTKVRLRLSMPAASEAERLGLPGLLQAKTTNGVTALSMGPDQWLLLSDELSADQLIARCESELANVRHLAVDFSAALNCATLRGEAVPGLLSMGAGIDWSAQCVRTRFAAIPVVAHRHSADSFDFYYDRSFRYYLGEWIAHALRDPLLAAG